jgi:hypothetical protein
MVMSSLTQRARKLGELGVKQKAAKFSAFLSTLEDPKFSAFLEMLEDPDLEDLIATLLNSHEGGAADKVLARHKFSPGLTPAILALCHQLEKQFTASDVQQMLEEKNFQFNGDDHRKPIRDALWRLVESKRLRVTQPGKGGRPSVYEWC